MPASIRLKLALASSGSMVASVQASVIRTIKFVVVSANLLLETPSVISCMPWWKLGAWDYMSEPQSCCPVRGCAFYWNLGAEFDVSTMNSLLYPSPHLSCEIVGLLTSCWNCWVTALLEPVYVESLRFRFLCWYHQVPAQSELDCCMLFSRRFRLLVDTTKFPLYWSLHFGLLKFWRFWVQC